MLLDTLKFEWRYFTRQPSFIVTCLVFFLLPYFGMSIDQVQIGSGGNVTKNSPYAITQVLAILSVFSMFLVVNFVGNTATRNHTTKMAEIVSTKPIQPLGYNLGRFFGAYLICLTVFAMVPIGAWMGSIMPWVDAERIGPNKLSYYLAPFLVLSVTTIFTLSALFYAVAKRTNSLMIMYVVAIALFMVYSLSGAIFDQPDQRTMRALLDPFGLNTFGEYTRYWTAFERNGSTIELTGSVLQNRAFWFIASLFILIFGGRLTKNLGLSTIKAAKKERGTPLLEHAPVNPKIDYKANEISASAQFMARLKFELKQTFSSPAFIIFMIISLVQLFAIVLTNEGRYGQPFWPVTQVIVESIAGAFGLQMLIVVAYFTGEAVWRERTSGMGDITDSTPTHNIVFWASKLIAICSIFVILMLVGILCGVLIQAAMGYTQFELSQYVVRLLYFDAYEYVLIAVLAFFLQAVSPNKYIGIMLFALFIISTLVLNNLGVEHNMFMYGESPNMIYSDMNGYGDSLKAHSWYMLYWTAFAVILGVISYGLWHRGTSSTLRERFVQLRYQVGVKGTVAAALALLVFVGAGANIIHNTRIVNNFTGTEEFRDLQADYEKKYAEFKDSNSPMVSKVDANVAIFPEQRRVEAKANITIENRGEQAITRALISLPTYSKTANITIEGSELVEHDEILRTAWLKFSDPLQAGEARSGTMESVIDHDGFKDRGEDYTVLENGTFINNAELFPSFGYNNGLELLDRHERRKRDLPEPERAHKLEDESRYEEHAFHRSMTFIDFKATISTSADQIAMAPGYLAKEWEVDGRKFFRYEMDSPMLNFYSITSARLAVKKEEYKGVSIEVYYHPTHEWNVDGMIQSTKDSLDYFQSEFGEYQHRQYRIIEFPRYRSFAQSFANTIPFSESIWFNDQRSSDDIDFVYFVNAHEMAHQWWGHQLGAANVQGSAVLSETLAEYSALAVMEKALGETKARHFLTYELDEYLRGRTSEILEENPLMKAENQSYIHYQKGSVVMMAIRHKIGEQRLNHALKALLDEYKYRSTPYPTTLDLVRHLKAGANEVEGAFIDDLFEQITLFDLRADKAELTELEDGRFKVVLTASAKKFKADGKGKETEQDLKETVEVALFTENPNDFAADNKVIYKQEHAIVTGENTIEIILDERPAYIGIDPFVRYIDRDTGNNILKL